MMIGAILPYVILLKAILLNVAAPFTYRKHFNLVWVPPPQDLEHSLYADHSVQYPTGKMQVMNLNQWNTTF